MSISTVFPWVRHLPAEETRQFMAELIDAIHDSAQHVIHANVPRAIVEWRATARILADPTPTSPRSSRVHFGEEDHGEVTA